MNTQEKNKLIAEFMGLESYESNGYTNFIFSDNNHRTHIDLHYNSSWDWLMPVVEKIDSLLPDEEVVTIQYKDCVIPTSDGEIRVEGGGNAGYTKIGAAYEAVVEFIKWYNKQVEIDADMASDFDREPDFLENK